MEPHRFYVARVAEAHYATWQFVGICRGAKPFDLRFLKKVEKIKKLEKIKKVEKIKIGD